MEARGNHPQGYSPQGREDQPLNPPPTPFEHEDPSTSTPVTCFNCNQPGHYANQCPNNIRGKAPTINMITVDVQQVTTQSKTTQPSQWDIQDSVRQQAKDWVDATNNANINHMKANIAEPHELNHDQLHTAQSDRPSSTNDMDADPRWQALADSQISMPLHKLLHLLPRFKDTVHSLTNQDPTNPSVNLRAPTPGSPLMDSQNPVVQLLIRGHKVPDCIIDVRSGVNVISEAKEISSQREKDPPAISGS